MRKSELNTTLPTGLSDTTSCDFHWLHSHSSPGQCSPCPIRSSAPAIAGKDFFPMQPTWLSPSLKNQLLFHFPCETFPDSLRLHEWLLPSSSARQYFASDSLTSPCLTALESCLYVCVSYLNEMFLKAGTMFCLPQVPLALAASTWILESTPPNVLNTFMNKCRDKWINVLEMRAGDYHNHVSHIPRPGGWMTVRKLPYL